MKRSFLMFYATTFILAVCLVTSCRSSEVVYIDPSVPDWTSLARGIDPDNEVVVVRAGECVLSQIAYDCTRRKASDTVHIISHGEPGALLFSSGRIHGGNLADFADEFRTIGSSLTDDGDILLYGCNVAKGGPGKTFVRQLRDLTGADIAASSGVTGSAALEGDWILERSAGTIESGIVLDPSTMEAYRGALDEVVIGFVNPMVVASDTSHSVSYGQSFTATMTGFIKDVRWLNISGGEGDLTLEIFSGESVDPGDLLYTQTFPGPIPATNVLPQSPDDLATLTMDAPVNITNGEMYTFYLTPKEAYGVGYPMFPTAYEGGTWYRSSAGFSGTTDLTFAVTQTDVFPRLSWSGEFSEAAANDGSVTGSSIVATLSDDTFNDPITLGTHIDVTNVPAGLTAAVNRDSDTVITVTLTGTADSHADANDVSNLTLTFQNGAFTTTSTASDVTNYSKTDGSIDFNDPEPGTLITIDSFEDYADTAALDARWVDSYNTPTQTLDTSTYYDGSKSLRMDYPPTGTDPYSSFIRFTFDTTQDWATHKDNGDKISLWFKGDGSNSTDWLVFKLLDDAEQPNVIGATFLEYAPNTDTPVLRATEWVQWEIDLSSGYDGGNGITKVKSIDIGIHATNYAHNPGFVYFDDIKIGEEATNTAPTTGTVTAANVTQANAGASSYTFTVAYSDSDSNFDSGTIDTSDVTVDNGAAVSNASFSGDGSGGTATYTVTPPGGSWDDGDNGTYTIALVGSQVGDTESAYVAANASLATFTVLMDTTAPTVSGVSIPNTAMKVGDAVTVTITVASDTDDYTSGSGGISGTIGGFTLGSLAKTNNTTYTAQFTVTEGGTDVAAGSDIPVNLTLTDSVGNTSTAYTTAISQASDPIDANTPTISSVSVPANATYVQGDNLDFTVNVDENVTVNITSGTPVLTLTIGATGKSASYMSGSGTTALLFRYTVESGLADTDGIALASTISLNSGTMQDAAGNNLNTTLNSIGNLTSVLVDSVDPTVSSVSVPANATYIEGGNLDFTVNTSENITVVTTGGTPTLAVTIGGTGKTASYNSGTGTSAIVFRYTIESGLSDTDGITLGSSITLNSGTMKDAAGNNLTTTLNSVGNLTSVLVDSIVPTVTSVSGPSNATYIEGGNLDFTVNTSENITVVTTGGTPTLAVTICGTGKTASYNSGTGTSAIVFRYTVESGLSDTDGITLGSSITLNSGTMKDAADNNLTTTLNNIGSLTSVLVDSSAPTVSSVDIPDTAMKVGDTVTVTITVANDTDDYTTGSGGISGTIGGFTLGSLSRTNDTTYTAQFTVTEGGTDVTAGSNIPVNITLTDSIGNTSSAYTTAISQSSDSIDANSPTISSVSIPDTAMKVDDMVTVTIIVGDDNSDTYTNLSGTIGGFTLGSLSRTDSTTYTAQFTVTYGGTDVAAGSDIPVSLTLDDSAGNTSSAYTTAISQSSDPISANNYRPTLTTFAAEVDMVSEDTEVEITLDELKAQGDEADSDGTVDAFVVQSVISGTLKIGASAITATDFATDTNATIDTSSNAYWTPAQDANGTLYAFTVTAQDDDGAESTGVALANVSVTAVNDPPVAATDSYTMDEAATLSPTPSIGDEVKITASDAATDDYFGRSVSISGDYAVIGVRGDDNDTGSAYVFEDQGSNWTQVAKLTASDAAEDDEFGFAVSISGDYIVIGAFLDDDEGSESGSAYIFKKPDTGWTDTNQETAKLTASDAAPGVGFGKYVSISGDYVVIGATHYYGVGYASGAAYIFKKPVEGWEDMTETVKLTASDAASQDFFGCSVSISGDYAVIGAKDDDHDGGDSAGSVYVFYNNESGPDSWGQVAKLTASDAAADDSFGISVSISGDYAVIGAALDDDGGSGSGSAYIFYNNQGIWVQAAKLTASDAVEDDYFGISVSISGNYAIIGANGDDEGGSWSGAAYFFKKPDTGWTDMTETAKLTASDAAAVDYFGISVSITGYHAVIGAALDDDGGTYSGSAYIYTYDPATLLGNDTDAERDSLTAATVTGPQHAAAFTLNDDGSFTYEHDGSETTSDSFTYRVYDGDAYSDEATVTITVNTSNDDPSVNTNTGLTVNNGATGTITSAHLETTDEEQGASSLTYTLTSSTANGTLTNTYTTNQLTHDGTHTSFTQSDINNNYITYTHGGTDTTTDSFGFTVADGASGSASGTFTITINARPTLTAFTAAVDTVSEDTEVEITLDELKAQGDEADSDGTVDAFVVQSVISGTLKIGASAIAATDFAADSNDTIDGNDNAYWTPAQDANGTLYPFTVRAQDDDGAESSGAPAAKVSVTAVNDPPVTTADVYSVAEGTTLEVTSGFDEEVKITAADGAEEDNFGYSVSICGDYAVIGAYGDDDGDSDSGSAYVFYNDQGTWSQQAKLTAADPAQTDHLGESVSISGDYVIVGACYASQQSGAVYVFKKPDMGWTDMTETARLTASDAAANDRFGYSVSICGDYAVIGTQKSSGSSAYIFYNDQGTWSQQAKLTASDAAADDGFGYSVSICGDYAVIGARGDNDAGYNFGEVYVFKKPDTGWTDTTETAKLTASDAAEDDYFGHSVSVSGDYAAIGAYKNDDDGSDSGAAYLGTWHSFPPLLANDTDVERSQLTAATVTGPQHAAAFTLNDDGTFTYVHDGSETTSDSFTYRVYDGDAYSDEGTVTITVTPVNDDPTVDTNNSLAVEDSATVTITSAYLETTDPEQPAVGLTYTVGTAPSYGTLFVDDNSNGTADDTAETITASETFTQDDIDNSLLKFTHDGSVATSDTFTFTVDDGEDGSTGSDTFLFLFNSPPTLTSFSGVLDTTNEDIEVEITFAELADQGDEADSDGTVDAFVVQSISSGTLKIGISVGAAEPFDAGTNDTIDASNHAYWTPSQDANGSPLNAFAVRAQDDDGSESDTDVTVQITVTPVNDAPTLAVNAGLTVAEDGSGTVATTELNEADPDDSGTGLTYTVTDLPDHGDLVVNGTTLEAGANTFTQGDIDNNLLSYTHDGGETTSDGFTFSLADDGEDGAQPLAGQTFAITVTPVNDPPFLANIESAAATFVAEMSPVAVTGTVTVSDQDHAVLQSATVTITANYEQGQDQLLFTDTGAIAHEWTNSTGVLTLTGEDTLANWQAALRAVTFDNTLANPVESTRTVSVTITDGDLQSAPVTRDITVITDIWPPEIQSVQAFDDDTDGDPGYGYLDRVVFTFDEELEPGQEDLSDWILYDADGVTNLLDGLDDNAVVISGNTVTITLADNTGTTGAPFYQYREDGDGGAIQDPYGNDTEPVGNNNDPTAEAGDGVETLPRLVRLNASGSTDSDGNVLTYTWTQDDGPVDLGITGAEFEEIAFAGRAKGTYNFTLAAADPFGAENEDTVSVTILNGPPMAKPGSNRAVNKDGDTDLDVVLEGSASRDPNSYTGYNDIILYEWEWSTGPQEVTLTQDGTVQPLSVRPTTVQDPVTRAGFDTSGLAAGAYTFSLTVTDADGLTDEATVEITVNDPNGNGIPVADAGVGEQRNVKSRFTLTGHESKDPDGDSLTYLWELESGPTVKILRSTSVKAMVRPTVAGTYVFKLTVNDGKADSIPVYVTYEIVDPKKPFPVAEIMVEGTAVNTWQAALMEEVTLDGTVMGVDESATTPTWNQVRGTTVTIADPAAWDLVVSPVEQGVYVFRLDVEADGITGRGKEITLTMISDTSTPPVADAGADQLQAEVGNTITLDGSASYDNDIVDVLDYTWTRLMGPAVSFEKPYDEQPQFTPEQTGAYLFQLQVFDGTYESAPDLVYVVVHSEDEHVPTAKVVEDTINNATVGTMVVMNGTPSSDPDSQDTLVYQWVQTGGPMVVLDDPYSSVPSFTPALAGPHQFTLYVDDSRDRSVGQTVTVNVTAGGTVRQGTHETGPGKVSCFVATAAYGTPFVDDVVTLRRFRDRVLLPTETGAKLVEMYYRYSPPAADAIARDEALRHLVRTMLSPVVRGIELTHHH